MYPSLLLQSSSFSYKLLLLDYGEIMCYQWPSQHPPLEFCHPPCHPHHPHPQHSPPHFIFTSKMRAVWLDSSLFENSKVVNPFFIEGLHHSSCFFILNATLLQMTLERKQRVLFSISITLFRKSIFLQVFALWDIKVWILSCHHTLWILWGVGRLVEWQIIFFFLL